MVSLKRKFPHFTWMRFSLVLLVLFATLFFSGISWSRIAWALVAYACITAFAWGNDWMKLPPLPPPTHYPEHPCLDNRRFWAHIDAEKEKEREREREKSAASKAIG